MKYRALDADGDYQFGRSGIFLTDSAEAVAQAVQTRLRLWAGEWFLDDREGTLYEDAVLGYGTQGVRDQVLKQRILETQGVLSIVAYESKTGADRKMSVTVTISTLYGLAKTTAQV
jgi:hypothetical protein